MVGAIGLLLGLAVLAALAAWIALPWLLAPGAPPPAVPLFSASDLISSLRSGPGQDETLNLSPAALDEVLGTLAGGGGSGGGLSGAWATLGTGTVDLHFTGQLPSELPAGVPGLRRLEGRPVQVDLLVAPVLEPGGLLRLTVERVQVGRVGLDALVPVPRLLSFAARAVTGSHPWWRIDGSAVVLDPAAAPPIPLGEFGLSLTPSAVAATPDALTVSAQARVLISLDAGTLSQALGEAIQAQGGLDVPLLEFETGRVVLIDIPPQPSGGQNPAYALTPSVPQTGVLRIAVAGSGPDPAAAVAALLEEALGQTPPWLSIDATGLSIDWDGIAPIEVAQGLRIRFLPQSVEVAPSGLQAWAAILPGS